MASLEPEPLVQGVDKDWESDEVIGMTGADGDEDLEGLEEDLASLDEAERLDFDIGSEKDFNDFDEITSEDDEDDVSDDDDVSSTGHQIP